MFGVLDFITLSFWKLALISSDRICEDKRFSFVCDWSLCLRIPIWERLIKACPRQSESTASICSFSPTRRRSTTAFPHAPRTHSLNNHDNRSDDSVLHPIPQANHPLFYRIAIPHSNRRFFHWRNRALLAIVSQLVRSVKL